MKNTYKKGMFEIEIEEGAKMMEKREQNIF